MNILKNKKTSFNFFIFSLILFIFAFFSPVCSFGASSKIVNIPLEITLEQETAALYKNHYQDKLENIIEQVNEKAARSGILRRFYIREFLPSYNKNDWQKNPHHVPDDFFNHEKDFVYIAIDSKTMGFSQTYYWLPSIIINGNRNYTPFWNVLGENGVYIFSHELMHTVGAVDLYLINLEASRNYVAEISYKNRYNDDIMSKWGMESFSAYTAKLINLETFPPVGMSWYKYQPSANVFLVYDKNKIPIPRTKLSFFLSSSQNSSNIIIDKFPEWSGVTDYSGKFPINEVIFQEKWDEKNANWSYPALLLIQADYHQQRFYSWLEITQVNELYWHGKENTAQYAIHTDWNLMQSGDGYDAEWIEQTQGPKGPGSPLEVYQGQSINVIVKFRNIGAMPWRNSGEYKVGFYVYKDLIYSTPQKYNNPLFSLFGQSYFAHDFWGASFDGKTPKSLAALLKEKEVLPGEIGTFNLWFQIPIDADISAETDNLNTPHREDFYREDLTLAYGPNWMKNTVNGDPEGFAHVWFPLKVVEK